MSSRITWNKQFSLSENRSLSVIDEVKVCSCVAVSSTHVVLQNSRRTPSITSATVAPLTVTWRTLGEFVDIVVVSHRILLGTPVTEWLIRSLHDVTPEDLLTPMRVKPNRPCCLPTDLSRCPREVSAATEDSRQLLLETVKSLWGDGDSFSGSWLFRRGHTFFQTSALPVRLDRLRKHTYMTMRGVSRHSHPPLRLTIAA